MLHKGKLGRSVWVIACLVAVAALAVFMAQRQFWREAGPGGNAAGSPGDTVPTSRGEPEAEHSHAEDLLRGLPKDDARQATQTTIAVSVSQTCEEPGTFTVTVLDSAQHIVAREEFTGTCSVTITEAGDYVVRVERPWWVTEERAFHVSQQEHAAHTWELECRPVLCVYGQVVGASEEAPVEAFEILVEGAFTERGVEGTLEQRSRVVAEGGAFCVAIDDDRPVRARAMIRADGYEVAFTDWVPFVSGAAVISTVQLKPSVDAWGKVEGIVRDLAGRPIEGAVVRVMRPGESLSRIFAARDGVQWVVSGTDLAADDADRFFEGLSEYEAEEALEFLRRTASDGGGRFAMTVEPMPQFTVTMFARGYLPWESESLSVGTDEVAVVNAVLDSGAALNVDIYASEDIARRPVFQEAHVISSALQLIEPIQLDEASGFGEFTVGGLPEGSYQVALYAYPPGTDPNRTEGKVAVPHCEGSVDVRAGETAELALHCGSGLTGGEISGVVPLQDEFDWKRAAVSLFAIDEGQDADYSGWLDREGAFRIQDVLPGNYGLFVNIPAERGEHVLAAAYDVTVAEGRETKVEIENHKVCIVGSVRREQPRREFVSIVCLEGSRASRRIFQGVRVLVVTNDAGEFTVSGLSPGAYLLATAVGDFSEVIELGMSEGPLEVVLEE